MKDSANQNRKIILAITGASGSIYACRLLERLHEIQAPVEEIAVIFSNTGRSIWESEIGSKFHAKGSAKEYNNDTFFTPFASG